MLFKPLPLSKPMLFIFVCVLTTLSWYLGALNNAKKNLEIPKIISESLQCQTPSRTNKQKFVVFITDKSMANSILETICQIPAVTKQFGSVDVLWSHNEQEISQYVGKGIADLALVKDNIMQAFGSQETHGYKVIAQYQDYAAYLFSLKEKPQLSKEYLWGKKIGLLDYPSSRSGHMVPKAMLNDLGISEENMQITYVKSHQALRDLLASGKVDLISSYWQEQDAQRFSSNYITPIQTKVSGSKWQLKMATQNTDLLCDIQIALQQFAQHVHSKYYSQLLLSDFQCPSSLPNTEISHDEK